MTIPPKPEFSRPFAVDRLGSRPVIETLNASTGELARLAARFQLVAIDRLGAVVRLERRAGTDIVHVEGRLEADVVQTCVVTLAPFPSHVEDSFDLDFAPDGQSPGHEAGSHEIDLDMDADPPEPIENGVIDTGELVAQHLSLALDPYPRSPGAILDEAWTAGENDAPPSPFDVLRSLKPQA
jgi:uncharacterized metal-binding protein YceD (DUF177 family)